MASGGSGVGHFKVRMAQLGIKDAFARYGAKLRNVQWSVSAWAPDGSLVVSLWAHHFRSGPDRSMEFADRVSRWSGPGNDEFRRNIARAIEEGAEVQLVIVQTDHPDHVESGQDGSKIKKEFVVRDDVIGRVVEFDGDRYVFRFSKRII
jgi:hypothetical protein